ncbi:MAG: hypothetical protein ABSD44_14800 [Terracidiphilus sp.]
MELILNLVWLLLAILMVRVWLRHARRTGASTRTQIAALAMLILILLPVISVTDDLQTIQNPAEVDCARRNHAATSPHSIFHAIATLPPPVLAELSFGFSGFAAPAAFHAPLVEIPALSSIQNRPPPAV